MSDNIQTLIAAAEQALTTAKAHVASEISSYPTPISGCDAQFNHLLAERTRLNQALTALNETVFVPTPRTPSPRSGAESQ